MENSCSNGFDFVNVVYRINKTTVLSIQNWEIFEFVLVHRVRNHNFVLLEMIDKHFVLFWPIFTQFYTKICPLLLNAGLSLWPSVRHHLNVSGNFLFQQTENLSFPSLILLLLLSFTQCVNFTTFFSRFHLSYSKIYQTDKN